MSDTKENEVFHELPGRNPDRALERQIAKLLLEQHIPAFRRLNIDVQGGVVTIRGRVSTFFEKQVARHTCLKVPGISKVRDGLRVGPPSAADIAAEKAETPQVRPLWKSPLVIGITAANLLCLATFTWFQSGGEEFPPTFPVRGKIVIEGEVASGAFVVFHPVHDAKATADPAQQRAVPSGVADKDGVFELTSYRPKDGAPPGEYVVTLQWQKMIVINDEPAAGPNVVPPNYCKPQLSPLRVKVVEGENSIPTFQISRNSSQGGSPRPM